MTDRKSEHTTDWEVIHTYTRAQAIADGVLIDVSETAREAGIIFPTALTASVWADYVHVPEGVEGQDEAGRLWDILWMLRHGARRQQEHVFEFLFELFVRNNNHTAGRVVLKAVCGPGDELEPVITVMILGED